MNLPAVRYEEPAYIRENWKRILSTDCPDYMRFVLVVRNVATVTNGRVLLRSKLSDETTPDGIYILDQIRRLIAVHNQTPQRYPDIRAVMPNFQNLAANRHKWSTMFNKDIVTFVGFCEQARNLRSTIHIQSDKAVAVRDPEGVRFMFKFGDYIDAFVDPDYLKLALVDMLKYEYIRIAREDCRNSECPLVLGITWEQCAIVMPQRGV